MKKLTRTAAIVLTSTVLFNGLSNISQVQYVQANTLISTENIKVDILVGETIQGFKLESKKWIEDVQSTAMVFNHLKSGAKLVFLQNKDDNKFFSINFATPVHDNTGVNHILEHSVLCGSKNYPVKDPFVILSKQSLNTFLNAETGLDTTMYPVASKNDTDFKNLMSVYLDAVFYPKIYDEPNILKQEGWHYEINPDTDELTYNGVVYNEMKGNLSSTDAVLIYNTAQSLFPDTMYNFISGGYPENIPDITYEKFIETHKKYYTPANSCIYLSGNLNIEETLKFIDENYLSKFHKKSVDSSINKQIPFNKKALKVSEYSVHKDSDINNKTCLSSNYVVGDGSDFQTVVGFQILERLLVNSRSAPLRKALMDNGIGASVFASLDNSKFQTVFSIIAENTNESEREKFEKVIDDTLKQIVKEGFDKDHINSAINSIELQFRRENSSAQSGLYNLYNVVSSWRYCNNPTAYLEITPTLNSIKSKIDHRYFENLVERYLLNNNHASTVVLKPSRGLNEKREAAIKENLAKYKASLSKEEFDKLKKESEELKKWQSSENSKDALEKMPVLSRNELDPNAEIIPTIETEAQGIKILNHPIFTNGIAYTNLYFDSSKISQDKIHYLKLLSNLLGKVDTEKYNSMEIGNELMNCGSIRFDLKSFEEDTDNNIYHPKMMVQIVSLNENLAKSFELLQEITNSSEFTDKEHLHELIKMYRSYSERHITVYGLDLAKEKALSYLSNGAKYEDQLSIPYYDFLCDLDNNFDAKYDEIVNNLEKVRDSLFNKDGLVVSYTGNEKNYKNFEKNFVKFSEKIKDKKYDKHVYEFDLSNKNEAFKIPSQVQYVVKSGNYKKAGYEYNGKMKVLQNILNKNYLWPEVRVKGGAYGGYVSIRPDNLLFYSYRDPNLKKTLNAFDGAVEFLRNFEADEEEMTNHIIGTIGRLDSLKDPNIKGELADSMYFTGKTQADIQKERDEILSTTAEDIRNFADMIEAVIEQDTYCVVGGETKIDENKDLFNNIMTPLNN